MSALPGLIDVGVAEFSALVRAGRIDPRTEHVLCHYSAGHFRNKLFDRLREAVYPPDEERWFTNLHSAGNTGAASIFVLCSTPCGPPAARRPGPADRAGIRPLHPGVRAADLRGPRWRRGRRAVRQPAGPPAGRRPPGRRPRAPRARAGVGRIRAGPGRGAGRPADRGRRGHTLGDYRLLLENLRQQVIDGGRWISLAAANAGSAALSAFVFYTAGLPDPVDLLGAMFVIEGLGVRKAARWADRLQESLGLRDDQLSFLRYHAAGDDDHFAVLTAALRSGQFDEATISAIVKTARVVARLYALQLEELGRA
jgi:3-oxoacyl-[acyl-carrier-protein] synthase-3